METDDQANDRLMAKRHSLAHLLAAAVLGLWPGTKNTIGPAIVDGFYYDFDFATPITEADLTKIEHRMREILPSWTAFSHRQVSAAEAKKIYAGNPYKLELVDEIVKQGQPITLYTSGNFTDLCRGGHSENPAKEIASDAFRLDHLAGAYWRGDEKNKMLTRIYGLAFDTKTDLEAYQAQRAEAEKRDHRKLGRELQLFTFDDDVGPGLPLWLPRGTVIIEELEKLAKQTEAAAGYQAVRTPHIAKESMYLRSGHLPYYAETMFPPMEYEGGKYYLRAMNCPHHHKIFAAVPRSYRDLPLRLAEYGTVYRHEKSGELFGLMRVRMLQMNDAHIYCTEEQFADEFRAVNDLYLHYFKLFGLEKYVMRLSLHDPAKLGQKYINEPELWQKTEAMARQVLVDSKIPFVEIPNEAAFYGPKIDVQVWSAIGREFTVATNQVDFAVPHRFGLTYTDRDGQAKTPLVIHRAPLGTHERLIGFLIEHYAGAFPVWLAPVQVKILTISDRHLSYAREVRSKLRGNDIRVELDETAESLSKKIRQAKLEKIPYLVIIGDQETASQKLTVESRDHGKLSDLDVTDFYAKHLEPQMVIKPA